MSLIGVIIVLLGILLMDRYLPAMVHTEMVTVNSKIRPVWQLIRTGTFMLQTGVTKEYKFWTQQETLYVH